jgi:hypothetical protein
MAAYLPARGLANIPFSHYPNSFSFIVGTEKYCCPSFVADFLSPKVARFHSDDPLLVQYRLRTPDPDRLFPLLLDAARGSPIPIDTALSFLADAAQELENADLCFMVLTALETELTPENIGARLAARLKLSQAPIREIEFIAANFSVLPRSLLTSLPPDFLSEVLCQPTLRLQSEDALYTLLAARFDADPRYFDLLEHVRFEFLSAATLTSFVVRMRDRLADLTPTIWSSLSRRLLSGEPELNPALSPRFGNRHIPLVEGAPFDGIVRRILAEHGPGAVVATSSPARPGFEVENVLRNNGSYFWAANQVSTWVSIDFGTRRIVVTDYAVRSRAEAMRIGGANDLRFGFASSTLVQLCPRGWVLEGSEDGTQWFEIDRSEGLKPIVTVVRLPPGKSAAMPPCRIIRFTNTGKVQESHEFVLEAIEFFGAIVGNH